MRIKFDEKVLEISDATKNIVEAVKDHGIYISAHCLYNKRVNGCCNGCIILVNDQEARACETYPEDGMNIIYDRPYLTNKRSMNLERYAMRRDIEVANQEKSCHSHDDGSCECGGNCSCH